LLSVLALTTAGFSPASRVAPAHEPAAIRAAKGPANGRVLVPGRALTGRASLRSSGADPARE
jgi:hypothetical protein